MPNDKLILLIQAKVLPEHRAEFLQAVRETLPLTRAETGVELLYPTTERTMLSRFLQLAFEHGIDAREALWNSNAYQRP